MYAGRVLSNGARLLGYHPFNYPSAVLTDASFDPDRSPCVSCGACANFGCPRNAKGTPAVTTLRRALLTGNCQLRFNCHVARLLLNPSRNEVIGVEYYDPDGVSQMASADRYVLAASPIESARLCFLSDPEGPGVGNSSGHLGRHLMFHFQPTVAGIFRQRLHGERGRSVTNGMSDFRGVTEGGEALHPERPLGGIVEFATSSEPILSTTEGLLGLRVGQALGIPISLKDMLVESPFQARIGVLAMMGEDAPQPTNRIDLDPNVRDVFGLRVPRITYRNSAFEDQYKSFYEPLMLDILEAAGAEYGIIQPPVIPPTSRHIMGGLRMGTDPSESVCDAFGKFHDVANLYCADGGVFPTGSGYNPTPTIIAVALRTAGALVAPGAPERVLRLPSVASASL
jgi:choline dehydrogenase-like flavoprotein